VELNLLPGVDQRPFVFHIPKTATTYYIELLRYKCEGVDIDGRLKNIQENDPTALDKFLSSDPQVMHCLDKNFSRPHIWHEPITGEEWVRHSGGFVGMFRDPTARIASGYAHDFHDCEQLRWKYNKCFGIRARARERDPENWETSWVYSSEEANVLEDGRKVPASEWCMPLFEPNAEVVRQYFDCTKGCAVNMMLGILCGDGGWTQRGRDVYMVPQRANPPASPSELSVALERLERFAAVGLMEEYEESVARLHSVFKGGAPFKREDMLPNIRPSPNTLLKKRVKEILLKEKMVDEQDLKLYKRAADIFYSQPNIL